MFNSTHTLVGLALARSGLDRWCPRAAWTAVIASNLPDIDIAAYLYSAPAYIDYHRGITHSIIGIPLLSLALAAALYRFSRQFWRTFAVALIAMSTHPLLDYMNTYGVRPYLPFDGSWFYGDTVFIIDPFFDLSLIVALALGQYFRKSRRGLALAGLALVVLYAGARAQLRNLSRSHLAGNGKAAVSPHPNPFVWTGLVDETNAVRVVQIDPLRGIIGEPDRMPKAASSEIIARAAQSRAARSFAGFARFPVVRVSEIESGYEVTFLDVRYFRAANNSGFAARVRLDSSLKIVGESLGFNQSLD
jgi:inner membrane protein